MKTQSKKEDLYSKIYAKALNFLGYQARSKKEVEDKLVRSTERIKSLSEQEKLEIREEILQDLEEQNLINDEKYALLYIQQRLNSPKPTSKLAMQQFLYRKGISKQLIQAALEGISVESEEASVNAAADKKLRTLAKYDARTAKQKLLGYLFTKGFSKDVVYRVVDTKFKVQ